MKKIAIKFKAISISLACLFMMTAISSCDRDDAPTPPVVTDPTTVTDIDGNVYTTVRIGTQLWTVENLRTAHYNDGAIISTGLNNSDWNATTTGAYSIYDDDNANNTIYGKLYNWYAVNTGKLAPAGWHIPTRVEWEVLVTYLGGTTVAGGKMKSKSSLWNEPNTGVTDDSKFRGLPGGYKSNSGLFALQGSAGYWWASTERNATQGNYLSLVNNLAGAATNGATKQFGYAVRLVKD